jgi:hypothetical protein
MTSNTSGGIQKTSISAITSGLRELTAEELERAIYLANIVVQRAQVAPGSQQKDFDLAQKMRAKAAKQHNANNPSIANTSTTAQRYDSYQASPDTSPPIPPIPQKKQEPPTRKQKDDNWEVRASKGITDKKLSLDRQWEEKSWNNKSNVNERLKLLKDDGYDIAMLQAPNVSSKQITEAVLAWIKVRSTKKAIAGVPPSSDAQKETAAPTPASVPREDSAAPTSSSQAPEDNAASEIPGDSFPNHPLTVRLAALPAKRKRTYDGKFAAVSGAEDKQRDNTLATSAIEEVDEHYRRVKCCTTDLRKNKVYTDSVLSSITQSEQNIATWTDLKKKARNDIFRRARAARLNRPAARPLLSSRIIVAFPAQAAKVEVPGDVELSSRGYEVVMRELRALSDTPGVYNEMMEISDPESVPVIAARVMQELSMDPAKCVVNQQALDGADKIRVSTSTKHRTIIEGNAHNLAGLCSRLAGNGLIHMEKDNFDMAGNRLPEDETPGPSELSYETCGVLGNVEGQLKLHAEIDFGGDIYVRWSHREKTPRMRMRW